MACQRDGALAEAEKYYKQALSLREKIYRANHPGIAESYENLGTLHFYQGRYRDALAMHLRALEIRQSVAEVDAVSVSTSLHNVGGDYWMLGRYMESEKDRC